MFLSSYYGLTMRFLAIFCIILATMVSFTIAGKGKCGPIARTNSPCTCKPKTAGLLKFADGKLVVCDGSEWKTLQMETAVGSRENPGYSCKDILDNDDKAADGVYWITLTGKFGDR